jgi:Tol biopolymer transport system component
MPPAPPSGSGGRKPLLIALIVVCVLALVATAALAYVLVAGGDDPKPTPTPLAKATTTVPSASPSGSPSAGATLAPVATIAAAFGAHSETLGTMDTDGNGAVLETATGMSLGDIQWSPDGKLIAYQLRKDRYAWRSTLMVYDVAAGTAEPVSFGDITPKVVYGYTWTSDTEIVAAAFETLPKWRLRNGALYRCDLAGGSAEPLALADGAELEGVDPSASADGGRLTYCSYSPHSSTEVTESLQLFDAASGTVATVADATVYSDIDGRAFDRPLLSPDGTQIFTEQTGSDVGFGVTIYSTEGAKLASIDYLLFPGGAAWDRSGSGRLVFGGRKKERAATSVFVYDSGSNDFATAFKVDAGGRDGYGNILRDFAWSPDGEWIAYTVMSPRHDYMTDDLWIARTDGSGLTRVSRDAISPSWADAVVPGAQPGDM